MGISNNNELNNITSSGYYGIYIASSMSNSITNSYALSSSGPGIYFDSSSINNITNSTINSTVSTALYFGANSQNNVILHNTVISDLWVNDLGSGNSYNDSSSGNTYYFADGSASWIKYDVSGETWASSGSDRPFSAIKTGINWVGNGNDWFPKIIEPKIIITSPSKGQYFNNQNSISLNYTISENGGPGINYSSCNGSIDGLASDKLPNCANTTIFVTSQGHHSISITAMDLAGKSDQSELINFTMEFDPPILNPTSPIDGYLTNDNNLNFTFNVSDALSPTMNCALFIDGKINETNWAVSNSTLTTFNVNNLSSNSHSWSITCTDQANNSAASPTRSFKIDNSTPIISLLNTDNSSKSISQINSSTIEIGFKPIDSLSSTLNCSLYLDGSLISTNSSAKNNTQTSFEVSGMQNGNHSWYITCLNQNGKQGITISRNYIVKAIETGTPASIGNLQDKAPPINSTYFGIDPIIGGSNGNGDWIGIGILIFGLILIIGAVVANRLLKNKKKENRFKK